MSYTPTSALQLPHEPPIMCN